jgi:hypothetical protein
MGWDHKMRGSRPICVALVAAVIPVAAVADDLTDPAMHSATARERDRQMVRERNRQELASVHERDARWAASRNDPAARQRTRHVRLCARPGFPGTVYSFFEATARQRQAK